MRNVLVEAFKFIDGYSVDKNTQIKLYTILYNIFQERERYRYNVFMKLVDYCEENKWTVAIKNNLQIIDKLSASWDITANERIEMYKKAVDVFISLDEQLSAYELMLKTLELFEQDRELIDRNKDFITRTITLALQHPKIAQFGQLYDLPAVKTQVEEKTDEKLLELLHIFTYKDLKDYTEWEKKNAAYLKDSNIDAQVCKNKIMYLSFCSLAMKDNVISYDELSKIVGINRDEIEDWIIDAIVNNIIDARIDQEKEEVVINTFTQRTTNLRERLDKVSSSFIKMVQFLYSF